MTVISTDFLTNMKFAEIEKSCWPAGQILLGQNRRELEEQVKRFKPKNMRQADFEKFSLVGSPDECAAKLQPYLDLGVTHFMLFFGDLPEMNSLRLFAETVLKQMG